MLRVEREHPVVRTNVLRTNVFLFKKKGGMNVMNVVVRETGPPCASKLPVKIKHIEILRRIIYYGS